MEKIELLSPAGDLERLKVTLMYGADAVYIGGYKYGLRANATNFTFEEMKEGCDFAHKLGKKVYLTVNIVFHNEETIGVYEYIDEVVKTGIDAIIVSDPFVINYIVSNYPNIEVHVSTQNSTTNYETVNFFKVQGVKRVVLARELSMEEIKEIVEKTGVDIEVFIHGSMCTFYSGRCMLSNYLTNRDANRGGCSQVCRFAFDIEDKETKFTMATKDLNLAYYIKDMIDIGVKSLKVEGRMRSLYYLATVISSYRKLIDAYYDNNLTDDLMIRETKILSRVANRETSSQYFSHIADETDQYYTGRQELSNQDYLGLVTGYDEDRKEVIIVERNYFEKGEIVEIFTPNGDIYEFVVDNIFNEDLQLIDVARHPEEVLRLSFDNKVPPYSMMRRKVD